MGVTLLSHTPIQLIVGLANPGKEYEKTRHNAGAWFVEEILREYDGALRPEKKFHGLYGDAAIANQTCHLLIPTTFMNLSGQSVKACAHFYKIPPESILVIHDEVDLPAGIIRLKKDGGDGGHNGLKDIISHLGTKNFFRLRIGVGRPARGDVADYVLNAPSKLEKQTIDDAIQLGMNTLPLIVHGDIAKAMQQLHTENANGS